MKLCPKCGSQYADDNMFCEICGSKLIPQMQNQTVQGQTDQSQTMQGQPMPYQATQDSGMQYQSCQSPGQGLEKKKINPLFLAIPIAILLLIAALLFLFRDELPFGKKDPSSQETVQQESPNSQKVGSGNGSPQDSGKEDAGGEAEGEKPVSGEETESPENPSGKESSSQEDASYADSDINGVDNAYVQVMGTVAQKNSKYILKLQEPSSVCAYNAEDDIIQKKKVKNLTLDAGGMEEYLGDTVEIKGKLSADFDGNFSLQPVKTEVLQEAKEETESKVRYQLIQADVTWEEAFSDCISRGGALAQINSEEEFQKVTAMIEEQDMQNVHFYLGGRRSTDSWEYYWADTANRLEGELLNPEGDSWAAAHWMENEPSFTSEGDMELYMNLIYYKGSWVLNDVPLDITQYYPGKTGYICRFDE